MATAIHDEALYEVCAQFVKAALALIRPKIEGLAVPTRQTVDKITRENGGHSVSFREEPDIGLWLFQGPGIGDLPELEAMLRRVAASGLRDTSLVGAGGKPIRDPKRQAWWLLNFYGRPLLLKYIGPELNLTFDDGKLREMFPPFEQALAAKEIVNEVVAPLLNFESDEDTVEIAPNLMLRLIRSEEVEGLWRMGEHGGGVGRDWIFDIRFCLATTLSRPKVGKTPPSDVYVTFPAAESALRLLGPGHVGIAGEYTYTVRPEYGSTGRTFTSSSGRAAIGETYHLAQRDHETLQTVFKALREPGRVDLIRTALNRFAYAYERARPEDKLVDHWIALESLFLGRDERLELSYKAALRMARFLGSSAGEREEIFRKIKKSYSVRSDIVHGKPPPDDIAERAAFTEEQLRRALRQVVLAGSLPALDSLDVEAARAQVKEEA